MIKDTRFIVNITRYCNYLERPNNWCKQPVATLPTEILLGLLRANYDNSGNLIYGIEVKR